MYVNSLCVLLFIWTRIRIGDTGRKEVNRKDNRRLCCRRRGECESRLVVKICEIGMYKVGLLQIGMHL